MKDYINLAEQFMEQLKATKNADGSLFYDAEYCTLNTFFKQYLNFAVKHNMGMSRTAFEKGLLPVLTALGFITKNGDEIRFGKTNFVEHQANALKEKKKEAKK